MATDPPKKRTGGSKKHQDASEELRIHMAMRAKVTRMSEMLDRHDQVGTALHEMVDRHDQIGSSMRELLSSLLVDLDKQGEKFMTRVEESGEPSTPPPGLPPAPETRPSVKPTVMALDAMNARTFERTIRARYEQAATEDQRRTVLDMLRHGLKHVPDYAADERLSKLEAELRRL